MYLKVIVVAYISSCFNGFKCFLQVGNMYHIHFRSSLSLLEPLEGSSGKLSWRTVTMVTRVGRQITDFLLAISLFSSVNELLEN